MVTYMKDVIPVVILRAMVSISGKMEYLFKVNSAMVIEMAKEF